jgi:hypothetical protein
MPSLETEVQVTSFSNLITDNIVVNNMNNLEMQYRTDNNNMKDFNMFYFLKPVLNSGVFYNHLSTK